MKITYPHLPLVRINAPEIFADPEFKRWFFNRPKLRQSVASPPAIATWHPWPQTDFGEYSDFFTLVCGTARGRHAEADGSECDMPRQIWKELVAAAWDAFDRPEQFQCLLWVSNLNEEGEQLARDKPADIAAEADPHQKMHRVRVQRLQDVDYLVSASSAEEARHVVEASDNADRDFVCETRNADWRVEDVEEINQ